MARLSFRCGEELVQRVDAERGLVPREAWLRVAVEAYLALQGRGKPGEVVMTDEGIEIAHREERPAVKSRAGGCWEHPAAGRTESRGQWWCAEPGCMRPAT